MASTIEVRCARTVHVTLDEAKFTEAFMEEFRQSFFPFFTIGDHAEHLAQLYAREVVDEETKFIEGYGPPQDFGITFRAEYMETEVQTDLAVPW